MQQNPRILSCLALWALTTLNSPVSTACAQSGGWTPKAPMPTLRYDYTAGVVNGKLYAVGGHGTDWNVSYAVNEAYDPATDTWTTKAPMPAGRGWCSVGVVGGMLYVVGGATGNRSVLNTVVAYNPATDTWTNSTPMPTARHEAGVGTVDNILYVIGGNTQPVGSGSAETGVVEAYDPAANTWTTKAPMPTPRQYFGVAVVNGLLYAIGGGASGGGLATAVEAYDPVANTWTSKAPLPCGVEAGAVGVINGIIYVAGGFQAGPNTNVFAYNPAADTWTTCAPMLAGQVAGASGVINGVLYVAGGYDAIANVLTSTNEAFAPFSLSVNVYAGLTLTGPTGSTYEIDYCNDLSTTNWTALTTFVLSNSPSLFIDTNSALLPRRFYRAVPVP